MLHEWLFYFSTHSESALRREHHARVPKLPQVLLWVTTVVDAHFSSLVLSQSSYVARRRRRRASRPRAVDPLLAATCDLMPPP